MQRKPGLDALRAVAILWVMWFHSYFAGYSGGGVLRWAGWMGVDLFFVLSGFLIGSQVFKAQHEGRLDLWNFYLRRGFRTLPAYLVVLTIYLLWPSMREAQGMMPVWQFLSYTLNLFINPPRTAFSHAWSLCVEEQFYLLFPALVLLLLRYHSLRFNLGVVLLLLLVGISLRAGLWLHAIAPVQMLGGDVNGSYLHLLYYPTYARMDDLVAGAGLAALRVYRLAPWRWMQAHANLVLSLGLALLLLCIAGFNGHRQDFLANVIGYPLLALAMTGLVAAADCESSLLGRCSLPGLSWIAAVSYSLYLSHKLVYGQLHGRLAPWVEGHGGITVLIYIASVFAVGAVLYYLVERPFLIWRDKLVGQRPSLAASRSIS